MGNGEGDKTEVNKEERDHSTSRDEQKIDTKTAHGSRKSGGQQKAAAIG